MNIWKVVHPFERSSNFLIHEEGAHSGGMVRVDEESANELFNTLADWNA
jgi:hypothetical protein